ncbi:MAG TPA: type II secretion system protein [Rhizomicrobium sp.]|nr:type II secretion system protein [Rhizomicrobium sp.]
MRKFQGARSSPASGEAASKAAGTATFSGAPGDAGFTLIEVLVALTILSISLATLLAIFLQGLDRAKESSNEGAARSLAQSLLSQAKAAPSLAYGSTAGKINQLQWRMQIEPFGSDADRTAWQAIPAEIVATVSWHGDGGLRTVRLSTLKLYPKPGAHDDDNDDN